MVQRRIRRWKLVRVGNSSAKRKMWLLDWMRLPVRERKRECGVRVEKARWCNSRQRRRRLSKRILEEGTSVLIECGLIEGLIHCAVPEPAVVVVEHLLLLSVALVFFLAIIRRESTIARVFLAIIRRESRGRHDCHGASSC